MWKKEHREQETKLGRKTKRYPSNMTDIEWATMQPLPPRAAMRGRRRECNRRKAVNGLRYLTGAGGLQLAACFTTTSRHSRPCIGGFDGRWKKDVSESRANSPIKSQPAIDHQH